MEDIVKQARTRERSSAPRPASTAIVETDEMQGITYAEVAASAPSPTGAFVKSYRIKGGDRYKDSTTVVEGAVDYPMVIVWESLVLLCWFKSPNRTITLEVFQ